MIINHNGPILLRKPRNKYGNKKTDYGGLTFDSKKEAQYAQTLDLLKKSVNPADRVVNYEVQKRYPMVINGVKVCTYVLDFLVEYADGRIEYVDVKGVRTGVYKIKKQLMKAVHGIEIKEV